ncbi:hypothetical protein, partial [Rhizorhapis sp. SPR117]|uniref:hypothetical protein n=1 Tax=Rhizorhapis sp. SPR117 TaxID=2912611 RepID=UPI001F1B8C64|nr:hypothetical protein [Rhizorhapis sp. SPR117]
GPAFPQKRLQPLHLILPASAGQSFSETNFPLNQAGGYARCMPGRFDFAHPPLPQYAVPAAALRLIPIERRNRNKKRGRFF